MTNKAGNSDNGPGGVRFSRGRFLLVVVVTAAVTLGIAALLTNIFQRKQEAKDPYVRFVKVTEETTDPKPWGINWPREYDTYLKTSQLTQTKYGGHGGSEALPEEKAARRTGTALPIWRYRRLG